MNFKGACILAFIFLFSFHVFADFPPNPSNATSPAATPTDLATQTPPEPSPSSISSPISSIDACQQCDQSFGDYVGIKGDYCINYKLIKADLSFNTILLALYSAEALACGYACRFGADPVDYKICSSLDESAAFVNLTTILTEIGLGNDYFTKFRNALEGSEAIASGVSTGLNVLTVINLLQAKRSISTLKIGSKVLMTRNTLACLSAMTSASAVILKSKTIARDSELLKDSCDTLKKLDLSSQDVFKQDIFHHKASQKWPTLLIPSAYAQTDVSVPQPLSEPPEVIAQRYLNHEIPLPVEEKPFTDQLENINNNSSILDALEKFNTDLPHVVEQNKREGGMIQLISKLPPSSQESKAFILQVLNDVSFIMKTQGYTPKKTIYPTNPALKKDLVDPRQLSAMRVPAEEVNLTNTANTDLLHSTSPYSLFEIASGRIMQVLRFEGASTQ